MRIFLTLLCLLLSFSCSKKNDFKKTLSDDFESLTGKDLPSWRYIQTKIDFEYLTLFSSIYRQQKELLNASSEALKIPKVAHFIWLGPKPFPRESVENIRTWMAKNPDWTFCFWTDRERPLPLPGMRLRYLSDVKPLYLSDCLSKSENYGEQSDLWRAEILYQEGGVYVDHDVKCFKSFEPLNVAYHFYCGIDMPFTSSLPSCVYTTNNLIGAAPCHPILLHYLRSLAEKWDVLQREYPGSDRDAVLNRVLHRTFWLFGEAVCEKNNQGAYRDIVFPAYFFDAPNDELALFARHQYAGVWHQKETEFEAMVRERLIRLSRKSNQTLLLFSLLSGLNFLGLGALFIWLRHGQRSTSA